MVPEPASSSSRVPWAWIRPPPELAELVAGQQHGAALVGQGAHEAPQPAQPLRVQAVGGLVEHEHVRVGKDGGGHREPLAHALAERAGAAVRGVREAHDLEQVVDAARADPGRGGLDAQVRARGAPGVDALLEQHADPARRAVQAGVGLAEDGRRARVGVHEADEHPQRRRLAGAVGTGDADHAAGGHRERDVVDRQEGSRRPAVTGPGRWAARGDDHRRAAGEDGEEADPLQRVPHPVAPVGLRRPDLRGLPWKNMKAGHLHPGDNTATRAAARCPSRRWPTASAPATMLGEVRGLRERLDHLGLWVHAQVVEDGEVEDLERDEGGGQAEQAAGRERAGGRAGEEGRSWGRL